ncbi:MAG: hypothetical protein M3134_09320 [Actinomycetota bacterium]|nr:hypothetical protein [Actinomycetota bacterium]
MHPTLLGQVAQDHVRSLILEADAARLARTAQGEAARPGLRRRAGLRLIALGERLAPECPQNAFPLRGGRA